MEQRDRSISDVVGEALGLDPNVKYRGSILPFVKNQDDSVSFGYPSAIVDMVKAFMLPGHVLKGGSYSPEDVTDMALNVGMMGAPVGYATAPRGALAMGGARQPREIPKSNWNTTVESLLEGDGTQLTADNIYAGRLVTEPTRNNIYPIDTSKLLNFEDLGNNLGIGKDRYSLAYYLTRKNDTPDFLGNDANIVGRLTSRNRDKGIDNFVISSDLRGQGFGQKLLSRADDDGVNLMNTELRSPAFVKALDYYYNK